MVTVLALAVSGGCFSKSDDAELAADAWQLVEFGEAGSMTSAIGTATMIFDSDAGKVTGVTGCNTYFADYSVDGDSISFTGVGATEMACTGPPGVMQQESTFLRVLSAVTRFEIEGNYLTLFAGDERLVFGAARRL